MTSHKTNASQEINNAIQAIKEGEKELKERKTIILSSLSNLLIKIGNHDIYR